MYIVSDLGFGDGGKGTIDDFLTEYFNAGLNFRYSGGPQAAHHYVGEHIVHCFAQFGSGSFTPNCNTYISEYMLVEPFALFKEAEVLIQKGLSDIWKRTFINKNAVVVTPFHIMTNRLREIARGKNAHGSTGFGVWETRLFSLKYPEYAIYASDLGDKNVLFKKLTRIHQILWEEVQALRKDLDQNDEAQVPLQEFVDADDVIENVIRVFGEIYKLVTIVDTEWFSNKLKTTMAIGEGAQGVLLSDLEGFHPHTSATDTTTRNAYKMLSDANYSDEIKVTGVIRGMMTRHGAGPFVTEDKLLTLLLPEMHNPTGRYQGSMRVGYLDFVALKYAMKVSGKPNFLSVTSMDRMSTIPEWKVCNSYEYLGEPKDLDGFVEYSGSSISGILKFWDDNEETQLRHMERVTQILLKSKPVYTVVQRNAAKYIELIENTLDVPVGIVSYGPTSNDKVVRMLKL